MFRVECPSCKASSDVDDSTTGQTVRCACGAPLRICDDAESLPQEIEVVCKACKENYVFPRADAGEEMECECGQDVWVPYLVTRRKSKKKLLKKADATTTAARPSEAAAKPAAIPQIRTADRDPLNRRGSAKAEAPKPDRQRRPAKAEARVKSPGSTEAKPVVGTSKDSSSGSSSSDWKRRAKTLKKAKGIARPAPKQASEPSSTAAPVVETSEKAVVSKPKSPAESSDTGEEDASPRQRQRRAKSVPWTELVTAGILLVFVIGSVLAYVYRGSGQAVAQQQSENGAQGNAEQSDPSQRSADDRPVEEVVALEEEGGVAEEPPTSGKAIATGNAIVAAAGGDSFLLEDKQANTAEAAANSDVSDEGTPQIPITSPPPMNAALGPAKPAAPALALDQIVAPSRERKPEPKSPSKKPRPVVPVVEAEQQYLNFQRAYQVAYEAFEAYQGLKGQPAEDPARMEALGQTIGRFLYCRRVIDKDVSQERANQIDYTLASLYLDAGYLYEAAVFAQHLVSYAPPEDPTAQAAAMIALAALQEAHQTQFGDVQSPGELRQIARLGNQIQARWPGFEKLDLIRYSAAQSFQQDGFELEAAREYAKVSAKSPFYGAAQLAVGRIVWGIALAKLQANPEDTQVEGTISTAAKFLDHGLKSQAQAKPTATLLAAQLARAQIHARRDRPQAAIDLLAAPETGVTTLASGKVKMSDSFQTVAYETLFAAQSQLGDVQGVQQTLKVLAKQYGAGGAKKIRQLYTDLARDYLEKLRQQSVGIQALDRLQGMFTAASEGQRLESDTKIWMASGWLSLVRQASDQPSRERCLREADQLFDELLADPLLEPAKRLAIELKMIEAFRDARQYEEALAMIEGILAKKPNTVDVQFQAAELLKRKTVDEPSNESFADAIDGPGESTIWGWQKLCKTLMSLHFNSDDSEKYRPRVLQSLFELNTLRFQFAQLPDATAQRADLLDAAARQLKQALATLVPDQSPWKDKLVTLQGQVESLR